MSTMIEVPIREYVRVATSVAIDLDKIPAAKLEASLNNRGKIPPAKLTEYMIDPRQIEKAYYALTPDTPLAIRQLITELQGMAV